MSFQSLKKSSQQNVADLSKEIEKLNKGSSFQDDRFWNIERDKSGNAFAIIRFLPAAENEQLPFVRIWSHGFKGPGGQWFIENCPTTLQGKCPVCEANSALWNSGVESDKEIARNRKRKLRYVSNIYVVADPSNRENEGKVFLYNYGKKIFDKINESLSPKNAVEKPINPFDFWKGRDFKLKIKTVSDFANYDDSQFESSSALLNGDDKELEKLWKTQYKLLEFVDPSKFKAYDELSEQFQRAMNISPARSTNLANPRQTQKMSMGSTTNPGAAEAPPFEPTSTNDEGDVDDFLKKMMHEEN